MNALERELTDTLRAMAADLDHAELPVRNPSRTPQLRPVRQRTLVPLWTAVAAAAVLLIAVPAAVTLTHNASGVAGGAAAAGSAGATSGPTVSSTAVALPSPTNVDYTLLALPSGPAVESSAVLVSTQTRPMTIAVEDRQVEIPQQYNYVQSLAEKVSGGMLLMAESVTPSAASPTADTAVTYVKGENVLLYALPTGVVPLDTYAPWANTQNPTETQRGSNAIAISPDRRQIAYVRPASDGSQADAQTVVLDLVTRRKTVVASGYTTFLGWNQSGLLLRNETPTSRSLASWSIAMNGSTSKVSLLRSAVPQFGPKSALISSATLPNSKDLLLQFSKVGGARPECWVRLAADTAVVKWTWCMEDMSWAVASDVTMVPDHPSRVSLSGNYLAVFGLRGLGALDLATGTTVTWFDVKPTSGGGMAWGSASGTTEASAATDRLLWAGSDAASVSLLKPVAACDVATVTCWRPA